MHYKAKTPTQDYLSMFLHVVELCQSVLEGLVQKNHVTQLLRTPDSVVQAVVRQGERLCAESDPRKGGYPAGYWASLQFLLSSPQRDSLLKDTRTESQWNGVCTEDLRII